MASEDRKISMKEMRIRDELLKSKQNRIEMLIESLGEDDEIHELDSKTINELKLTLDTLIKSRQKRSKLLKKLNEQNIKLANELNELNFKKKPPKIFISYSSCDRVFAKKLVADLKQEDIKAWIDEGEIKIGDSLMDKIGDAINEVDYLAVILSKTSVKSNWVKKEIEIAMNQEMENGKVKVLPLLLEKCNVPWFLMGKKYADFTSEVNYNNSFNELLDRLNI